MYCENIYINYGEFPKLEDEFESGAYLNEKFLETLQSYNFDWLTTNSLLVTKIKALISSLAYPIYSEYYNDRIAYEDKDTFLIRIINSLAIKVNRWYAQHKIEEDLIDKATLENFISNGGTTSNTKENASTGSAVVQKSASTPTGITHNVTEENIEVGLSHDDTADTTELSVDDGYEDKYTNFVGKTNGLHRNEVDRDTNIERTSNYGLALEILDKLPFSFINDVLKDVSIHFIQIY